MTKIQTLLRITYLTILVFVQITFFGCEDQSQIKTTFDTAAIEPVYKGAAAVEPVYKNFYRTEDFCDCAIVALKLGNKQRYGSQAMRDEGVETKSFIDCLKTKNEITTIKKPVLPVP